MTELIIEELDLDLQAVAFNSDSRVVLGYISDDSRRFLFMSATGWSESGNPHPQNNGFKCQPRRILLT